MYQIGKRAVFLTILLSAVVASCSGTREYLMVGSSHAPGSDGMIVLDEIDEGSTLVTVHMERLPPPSHLGDDIDSYLVWFQEYNKKPIKAGVLTYHSETRTGDITRNCPFNEFKMMITAERDQNVKTPSHLVIAERTVKPE
ncbi:MAG: hypothetical protein JXA30_22540 [Deltaproteobacteria bacterium]|nr:hypothetical protein [Deltaproteobacteria bacterium]